MIATRSSSIAFVALGLALAAADVSARDILFRKASRDYDETGELGRAYTREFESRLFTHRTWLWRLYCHSDPDDMDDTVEIYAKPDGSRWLSYRRAKPALSREIIRRYFDRQNFDLKKSLDSTSIKGGEIRLPPNVATEIEALWHVMLPGLDREPRSGTRIVIVSAPTFIGFRREGRSIIAGTIADVAYGTPAYRDFVDIVDDLIDSCRKSAGTRDAILARLPQKMQKLRARLSKSSNQAMERTADRRPPHF
jgi:uncharacterized coiled-coil protein SlyX